MGAQGVLNTHMGNTYPNHKGNYYYRNHTLYHIGTLDPLGSCFTECRLPVYAQGRRMD